MENVLILTEKKYMERVFNKHLPNIKCLSIGGHAYTLDEEKLFKIPQETLDSSVCVKYKDKEGVEEPVYILNSQGVECNCQEILNYLEKKDVDFVVNACDFDKNGDYLFKYAVEDVMKLKDTQYSFRRMKLFDLTKESIVASFKDILNSDDNLVKASMGGGMSFSNKLSMMETNKDNNIEMEL